MSGLNRGNPVQVARAEQALRFYKPYGDGHLAADESYELSLPLAADYEVAPGDVECMVADLLHYSQDRGWDPVQVLAAAVETFNRELSTGEDWDNWEE